MHVIIASWHAHVIGNYICIASMFYGLLLTVEMKSYAAQLVGGNLTTIPWFLLQPDLNLLDHIDDAGAWLNSLGDDILPSEDVLSSFLDMAEAKV